MKGRTARAIGENTDDDGRHTVEQVRSVAHDECHGATAELREIDRPQEADGDADEGGQKKQLPAADDGIGHTATGFPDGTGSLVKKFQLMDVPP